MRKMNAVRILCLVFIACWCHSGVALRLPCGRKPTTTTTEEPCEGLSYDGRCYFVVERQSPVNKSEATDLCRQNGAELANILSAEHYNVTYSYVLSNQPTQTTVFLWVANTYDFSREDMVITTDGGAFEVPLWYYSGKPHTSETDRTSMQILIQHSLGGFDAAFPFYTGTPFCV